MELDELKSLWHVMDRKMARHQTIQLGLLREQKLGNARSHLRPLYWGMALQIIWGILSMAFAAPFWIANIDTTVLWVCGLIVHAYGLLAVMLGANIMLNISRLDMSAPIVTIQKQMLDLRKSYIRSGWMVGLPWWILWLPYTVILSNHRYGLFETGLPTPFVTILIFCIVFTALTTIGVFWASSHKRPKLARKTEAWLAGTSLSRAQHSLDELQRFEQEEVRSD